MLGLKLNHVSKRGQWMLGYSCHDITCPGQSEHIEAQQEWRRKGERFVAFP